MTDILIRDVPPDVVAALDAEARRLGLSRADYLKRQLLRVAARPQGPTTHDDLVRFSEAFADLGDPEVMAAAWE